MSTALTSEPRQRAVELYSGDRMSRAEFHQRYELAPENFKAELIGGTVYVASPLRLIHGTAQPWLSAILFAYQVATPGVELGDNTTVILSDDSELQPDLFLRILPQFGGRSRNTSDGYVEGPPELVIEIAHSSKAIDLHSKRADYILGRVPEYLVYLADERALRWFDLAGDREMPAPADGIYRISQFPGLWIDTAALAARDHVRLNAVLQRGIASAEHAEFARRLAEQSK